MVMSDGKCDAQQELELPTGCAVALVLMLLIIVITVVINVAAAWRIGWPSTATLPPSNVAGFTIGELGDTEEAQYAPLSALLIYENQQVYLDPDVTTVGVPNDGVPHIRIYKVDGRLYVVVVTDSSRLTFNKWNKSVMRRPLAVAQVIVKSVEEAARLPSRVEIFKGRSDPLQFVKQD